MVQATVDRIEGEWIILVPETGPNFQIPLSLFSGLKEGNVVNVSITMDEQGEKEATERITEIRKGLNKVEL